MAEDHHAGDGLTALGRPGQALAGAFTSSVEHPLWHAAGETDVLLHRWGSDTVVFVRSSGATHWLSPHAAALLLALRSRARPVAANDLLVAGEAKNADDLGLWSEQLASLGLASIVAPAPR